MTYCSRPVSGQVEAIHPNLAEYVDKHLTTPFQRPIQPYNQQAIDHLLDHWQKLGCPPLVLDSGCGVGESTLNLSQLYPDHLVVGIDQSEHRLTKHGLNEGVFESDNYLLLRADLIDCWRLLVSADVKPEYHYIPYPNPWPKKKHLKRRWHGHPVFADLLRLGGKLELRSNWKTYVDEFAFALYQAGFKTSGCEAFSPEQFLTPFEKKYFLSGQTLYKLRANLNQD